MSETTTTIINKDPVTPVSPQDDSCIGLILAKLSGDHLDEASKSRLSKEEKALEEAKKDIEYVLKTAGSSLDKVKKLLADLMGGTKSGTKLYDWLNGLKSTADSYTPEPSIQKQIDELNKDIEYYKKGISDIDGWLVRDKKNYDDDIKRLDDLEKLMLYWGDKLQHGEWYEQIAAPFVMAGIGIAMAAIGVAIGYDAAELELQKSTRNDFVNRISDDSTKIGNLQSQLEVNKSALACSIESGCSSDAKKAGIILGKSDQNDASIQTSLKYLDAFSKWVNSSLKDLNSKA